MRFKSILPLLLSLGIILTAIPAEAAETANGEEPVKYENELYHIGYDIPADSYFLIPKDNTKTAFVGVYSNTGNPKAELHKYYELSVGTEIDYLYPHYFEEIESFRKKALKAIENEGICMYSRYFEFTGCIDLSSERKANPSYNFLYLENCYAVSVKYADKLEWEPNNNGFMPVSAFYKKGGSYVIKAAEDKPCGSLACYKYDQISGRMSKLEDEHAYNPLYLRYTLYDEDERPPVSGFISIPRETNIILKEDADIFETNGTLLYTNQDLAVPDNYIEKYNFNDITPAYKISVIQQVLNLNSAFYTEFFKSLTSSAKTEADKEYCKYAREIGVIAGPSVCNNIFMERYFSPASSFKELEQFLRYMVYLNPNPRTGGRYDGITPYYGKTRVNIGNN
ncbi:MAG: hypothetical protein Q4D26_02585 [Clostridia bacterium]|nr:hypothetical protein [Clostridia bacterium]